LNPELTSELSALKPGLERLERLRGKLNFFKAIGAARAELRHSDFLAFLLSPTESHNLGDKFLKAWLPLCLRGNNKLSSALGVAEINDWDLTDTEIQREADDIDLQVVNRRMSFGIVVENKTDSGEHSDQLRRYWDLFSKHNHDLTNIIGVYLSPNGSVPTDPRYIPVSYKVLHSVVDEVLRVFAVQLGADLKVLLRHYKDLLEIEFMGAQKESTLAWEMHKKYSRAA
jgi:hypothetical protein